MKKIIEKTMIFLCIFVVAITAVSCNIKPKPEIRPEIKAEIEKYNKEANKNGNTIIDMNKNPYFMEKQQGYSYNRVENISYYSGVTKTQRQAGILMPIDFDENKSYPVLYMLHGLGGSHKTWRNKNADIIIQNLIYFEDVPEMIVVFPNSVLNEKASVDGLSFNEQVEVYDRTEEDLVNYLMPYIEKNYPINSSRDNTAIVGNSMGGRNTLYIAFKNQKLFGYVGAFSASHVLNSPETGSIMSGLLDDFVIDKNLEAFKITLCVGRQDNICGGESYIVHRRMEKNSIKHVFYDMDGGHQNAVWQNALYNFVKTIFK